MIHLRVALKCQNRAVWGMVALCSISAVCSLTLFLGVEKGIAAEPAPPLSASVLSRAIDLSGGYLERSCDARGRFVYRVDPNSAWESHGYNIIRHAGAIYGLSMLNHSQPDEKATDTMARAGSFLRTTYLSPGPTEDSFIVWTKPAGVGMAGVADLGATGLGIVALASVQRAKPNDVSTSDLEGMARFLIYLQKSDGSFYSKYTVITGPVGRWESLYFPGEAILGLVSLYEVDHDRRWLVAAAREIRVSGTLFFRNSWDRPLVDVSMIMAEYAQSEEECMNLSKPDHEWSDTAPPNGGWYEAMMGVILVVAVITDVVPFLYAIHPHPGHAARRSLAGGLTVAIPLLWACSLVGRSRLKKLIGQTKADPAILELASVYFLIVLVVAYSVVIVAVGNLFSS